MLNRLTSRESECELQVGEGIYLASGGDEIYEEHFKGVPFQHH